MNQAQEKPRVKKQYRVVWKRTDLPEKRKQYWHLVRAQRFVMLLGPEPWKALEKDPDDNYCCTGWECGCGGISVRDQMMDARKQFPEIEYVRIEEREVIVGPWVAF